MLRPAPVTLASIFFLGACATGGGGTADWGAAGESRGVGQPLPELTLKKWSGGVLRTRDLRGKVVLLDLWASWCEPCKEEMPLLDDMAVRLRGRGVEIVAVSIDEDRAAAEEFLRARRARWTLTLAHDPAGEVPERLQPPKMPTSYIVDARGVVRFVNAGFRRGDAATLEAKLLELAGR